MPCRRPRRRPPDRADRRSGPRVGRACALTGARPPRRGPHAASRRTSRRTDGRRIVEGRPGRGDRGQADVRTPSTRATRAERPRGRFDPCSPLEGPGRYVPPARNDSGAAGSHRPDGPEPRRRPSRWGRWSCQVETRPGSRRHRPRGCSARPSAPRTGRAGASGHTATVGRAPRWASRVHRQGTISSLGFAEWSAAVGSENVSRETSDARSRVFHVKQVEGS